MNGVDIFFILVRGFSSK